MLLPQHFEEKDFHLHVPLSCLELSLADYPPHCLCSNCFSQTNRTNFFQGSAFQSSIALRFVMTLTNYLSYLFSIDRSQSVSESLLP